MSEPVLEEHQPDAIAPVQHPSLQLYGAISVVATLFVVAAFAIKGEPDWPGLFLNVSAGLISALVVLIVVERRLRQSDLHALRQVPIKAQMSILALFSRPVRAAKKYAMAHLEALAPLLSTYIENPELTQLEPNLLSGCNLLGAPGMGKTVWMQSVVAKHARKFLESNGKAKVVVLFPLKQWRENKTLEEAIIEHIVSFAACSKEAAQKALLNQVNTILLDGYDEIFMQDRLFSSEYEKLKNKYSKVPISVSSRPNYPNPLPDSPTIQMPELSSEQIEKVRLARESRRRNA